MPTQIVLSDEQKQFLKDELQVLKEYLQFTDELEGKKNVDKNTLALLGAKVKEILTEFLKSEYRFGKGTKICEEILSQLGDEHE
jgi:uncharacterized protein YpuA (DUF1002 family)